MDAGQTNYVGLLNERAQKKGWTVRFDLVQTVGPDHIKTFTMRVVMNDRSYPEGVGRNKKEAKQNAAKNALRVWENDEPVNTETILNSSASVLPVTQVNFICWLNEYSHKERLPFKPKETTKMSQGSNIQMCRYVCNYVCGDKEFPEATGNSKKEAKEAAAKLVYELLTEQEKEQVIDENGNGEEITDIQNLSTGLKRSSPVDTENTTADKNFIGQLNHYCQKSKQVVDFKIVERRGPAHDPQFVYRFIISGKEYPEACGKTAKEAKQKAAQLAWSELQDSDFSSQVSSPSSMSESADGASSSEKISKNDSKSESIVFKSTPSVPEPQPLDVKPKRQLAAVFQNSPVNNKKQSNINSPEMAKPSSKSTTISKQQPTKSRFLEEFNRESITRIGKGGFGRVFKARRKLEDKNFAVKIVKDNEKARREVKALSRLKHPNIVRYHTSWTEETEYRDDASETFSTSSSGSGSDFLYIQMEFCEGETLREWIEERNKNPEKYPERRQEAAEIIKQVLEAVKYVHLKKLFHRDLKPANIMFGHNKGDVKVVDFGLVTKEEENDDGNLLERTKRAGTRSYMSPEQRQENRDYCKKVDIYAVGLIYFELLWCFATQSEKQKQWDNIRSKKFPEEFSKRFDFEHKLIERMLCENPDGRPEASDLLTELEQHYATTASTEHNTYKENRTY
ncbi:interferon-induced, double-stranded RNA-activated protein kinase isoform X1 [Ictalurus punctatus]|uniref:non-specific serine/threonine protein kinase n=1 Tax=Ictalurus punctatus TaxID=7998 RepID=A0A2D0QLB0_ICTPU|nr:interferon-induced, double-stranded RNA-activated protein kinase isoform X1 [Ictalurus punctatus]